MFSCRSPEGEEVCCSANHRRAVDGVPPSVFDEQELVDALERMYRPATAGLSAHDRYFWQKYSGIAKPRSPAMASLANAAAQLALRADAMTAAQAGRHLGVDPSTVRHYRRNL